MSEALNLPSSSPQRREHGFFFLGGWGGPLYQLGGIFSLQKLVEALGSGVDFCTVFLFFRVLCCAMAGGIAQRLSFPAAEVAIGNLMRPPEAQTRQNMNCSAAHGKDTVQVFVVRTPSSAGFVGISFFLLSCVWSVGVFDAQ